MDKKDKQLLDDIYYASYLGARKYGGDSMGQIPFTFLDSFKASKQWVKGASQEEQLKALAKFLVSYYGLADSIVIEDQRIEHTLPVIPIKISNCLFLDVEERAGQMGMAGLVYSKVPSAHARSPGARACPIRQTLINLMHEMGTQTFASGTTQEANQCSSSIFLIPLLEKEAELLGKLDK